ncbi:PREDICTED: ABC transporter B family member 29, chloroplastic isoform X2 [Theobroma cacao]|uniref:ABC transporter B family member 29, chloroplastic isoform X2 n=1 Tax=Theobroma cacao TaxID=3641 RepID=A0AB32V3T3_THECC|nr:PREDICTED: ABC transporter B family member 29, chloroplastic isoform X2 [Theobroma cacao]
MPLHRLILLSPPSQPPLPPPSLHLHLRPTSKLETKFLRFNSPSRLPFIPPLKLINSTKLPLNPQTQQNPLSKTLETLTKLKPFLQTNHQPILLGWLCSSISVFSLLKVIPRIGSFSSNLTNNISISKLGDQGLVLGVLLLAKLVACYWKQVFLWEAALRVVYQMRVFVFEKVLERELGFFEGGNAVSPGDIAYRITAEASDVADIVFALLNTIVPNILQLFAMATQMLVISPSLSLISAMVIPCMAFVIAYLGERLLKISTRAHLSIATLAAYLNEGIGKAYNELKQGEPAVERLFFLTKLEFKVIEKPDAIDLSHVNGEVKFCDVSFKYADNMPHVLDGLNLHIKAGETIALVGPSGGGKTTLVKLLLRLYKPSSGSILVDNRNIQNIRLESLRRHVGLVSQDIMLFSGTVAENIGYRDLMTNIDMERVELAARIANADEFVRTLPEGYRSHIGPRGSLLSAGQKQRLAIARAVYQNSSILVLDEATSALDSRSELLVRQAVERLMENHTVLVIAHRLETVLMADRAFLLQDGKLEELTESPLLAGHCDSLMSTGVVI